MTYSQFEFFTQDEIERDWLISIFTEHHFEGFEETTQSLKAFVPADMARDLQVKEILYDNDFHHIRFERTEIAQRNWNEDWEKSFEPVLIAGKVRIRAPFHTSTPCEHELIIEPKMSFGTGHHATTALMIELMLKETWQGKTVLDFGSGTGVLAILASKLGAEKVLAIDNEQWAFENCEENCERNNVKNVTSILGDESFVLTEKYDVVLANINRNVIVKNIGAWKTLLRENGVMLVSGLLLADEKDVENEARRHHLRATETKKHNGWVAIRFTHS